MSGCRQVLGKLGTAALAVGIAGAAVGLAPPSTYAAEPPAAGTVTLVASSTTDWWGDLDWRDGQIYTIRTDRDIVQFPDDGSQTASPTQVTPIPEEWRSDGWWQSDRGAFVADPDGGFWLRAPWENHMGGGGVPSTHGWGVGHLAVDGDLSPEAIPGTSGGSLGGSSESLALDPDGSGVFLAGARSRSDSQIYGIVARLPLPAPDDQQQGAEIVASADGYDPQDPSTFHEGPFLAGNGLYAPTEPMLARQLPTVAAKGRYLYFRDSVYSVERVDRTTHEILSIAGGPYHGWDTPPPAEGDVAMDTFVTIQAGPVADRAGNVFISVGDPDRFHNYPGTIWEIRGSDGTLHRVAGGGDDQVANTGDDPLSLQLKPADLALDEDGNLYVSSNGDGNVTKQIVRINGVAAADTVPGAPSHLSADPANGALKVSFDVPGDDGGQPVTSYTVRAHPHGVTDAASDVVRTVSGSPVSLPGLANGTAYDVSVIATNPLGDGPVATILSTPEDWRADLTADVSHGTAPVTVHLDASGSRGPADATYQFFCGDGDTPVGPASTATSATCTYQRGSTADGWVTGVRMTDASTGRSYEATVPVVVDDPPGTVEGSSGFDTTDTLVDVPAADDGSLTSASCGEGHVGATCVSVDGAEIVLTAAPGTFTSGSHVQVYRGDTQTLQSELGQGVVTQGGFAVTWTPKVNLTRPLIVTIKPTSAGSARRMAAAGLDLGGFFRGIADGFVSGAQQVATTIGSAASSAATAVSSFFAGAAQSLKKPNGSATNDVVICFGGEMKPTLTGLRCDGTLLVQENAPTERIATMTAGAGVVAAGGMNVVAAGGGNVVASGGANLTSVIPAGASLTLNANSVVAAGGLNVIAPGGANAVAAGGANVVASGGANVVAAGGGNLRMTLTRDPGFVFAAPVDPTPPSVTATLTPPLPESGVYPYGTEVHVHLAATASGDKTVKSLHYDVTGAQQTGYTLAAGEATDLVVKGSGTSTVSYGAADDQLADSEPGELVVQIAAPAKPDAPTGVAARAGADRHSVDVSWVAPAGHGDLPLTGFRVTVTDRGPAGDGNGADAPKSVDLPADQAAATVGGLSPGHRYVVTVRALSEAGAGPESTPTPQVVLPQDPPPPPTHTAPGAPTGLTSSAGDARVQLSWTAPADTGGQPIKHYVVSRATSQAGPYTPLGQADGTTYEDATAVNGTTYYYVVAAVNDTGTSAASSPTSATPAHPLSAQTVTFTQPADRTYGDHEGSLVAEASSGLPVTFTSLTPSVCTVGSATLRVVGAGTCTVEASQAGDADHAAAVPVARSLEVARADLVVRATRAVMVRRGKVPAVGAAYRGFVNGDALRDLDAAASCAVVARRHLTTCAGVEAANYRPVYRDGRLVASRTGYAIVSVPAASWPVGETERLDVEVDGGRPRLTWSGRLPDGIRAVFDRGHTALAFVGTGTVPGTTHVTVTARDRKGVRVATQRITVWSY